MICCHQLSSYVGFGDLILQLELCQQLVCVCAAKYCHARLDVIASAFTLELFDACLFCDRVSGQAPSCSNETEVTMTGHKQVDIWVVEQTYGSDCICNIRHLDNRRGRVSQAGASVM